MITDPYNGTLNYYDALRGTPGMQIKLSTHSLAIIDQEFILNFLGQHCPAFDALGGDPEIIEVPPHVLP